jgi:hypothetical protein
MHPGPSYRHHPVGFIKPVEVLGADEFRERCEDGVLTLYGPDDKLGYRFNGRVSLTPCVRRSDEPMKRDYLFLAKTWDNGTASSRLEIAVEARGLEVEPDEFARELLLQNLRVGIDRYGNGRIFFLRDYAEWNRVVGPAH